jgi:hypothetical protein
VIGTLAKYAPDGRLFISFRDTTLESPTKGDWVAWVGRYEDIVQGREGQYRVRFDEEPSCLGLRVSGRRGAAERHFCGKPLTGTGPRAKPPYIVSVRLKLEELDAKVRR